MPVAFQDYEQACVFTIDGDLDADNVGELHKAVQTTITDRQLASFVVDLDKCTFVDSAGLEGLLWLKMRSDELFGHVKLINVSENVRTILVMTRLEPRFECCQDLASAMKRMQ